MQLSKLNKTLILFILISSFATTIGYSALSASLSVSGDLVYRTPADIRITGVKLSSVTNGGLEQYTPKYTKDTVSLGLKLPNLNSTVVYEVTVTNKSSKAKLISEITNQIQGNTNIVYSCNYSLNTTILGNSTMKILFTYKYNSGITTLPSNTIKENTIKLTFKDAQVLYQRIKTDFNDSTKYIKKYDGDTSTFTGDQEIYYYYGSASDNNVLFANYCWKIIRTTDTGGVKLLYNGVPAENGSCNNTGSSASLTAAQMNASSSSIGFSSSTSPAYVGYMYNTLYKYMSKSSLTSEQTMLNTRTMLNNTNYNYYYADTYTRLGSSYKMNSPTQYNWTNNYKSLVGKYTCQSASASTTSCYDIYYVVKAESLTMYYITLSSGNDLATSSTVTFSDAVTPNDDGTYTLTNPVEVNRLDWNTNYGTYKNYYTCGNNVTTCNANTMKKVTSTNSRSYSYSFLSNTYRYGNSFTWDGTNYTLTDTIDSLGIPSDINTHHYTCWNITGVCNKLNYIYYVSSDSSYYISLSDGKSVEDALNEMLYNNDVNTNNSLIKTAIDYWYANNMTAYTKYLEDTVWCNDRSMSNQSTNGWNPNGGSTSTYLYFKSVNDDTNLTCKNKNDRFTVNEANGNGALTYPVGLIDATEANLSYSNSSPHKSGSSYWTLSPGDFSKYDAYNKYVYSDGRVLSTWLYKTNEVRPAVSLRAGTQYSSGDGSVEKPFVIEAN